MSWLDDVLGTGGTNTPLINVAALTPAEQQWFIQRGINPNTLTPQQQAIAFQQMHNDIAAQDAATKAAQLKAQQDAAAAAQQAEQQRLAQEAQQKALAEEQARQAAAAEQQRIADEQERARLEAEAKKVPLPPDPVPVAPTPTTVTPGVVSEPGLTPEQVNQRIAEEVAKALETERTNTNTQRTYEEQQRAAAQQKADAAAAAAATANTQRLAGLRDATKGGMTSGIQSYFQARGVNPTAYQKSIDDIVAQALGNISPTDETPSARVDVTGLASRLFGDAENARRTSFQTQLQQMFPESYTNTQVGNNLDDDIINQLLGENRTSANAIVDNMLKRGVITGTGAQAAYSDLDKQMPIAQTRLNQIGTDLIGSERNSISDIISRANKAASTLSLGGAFDPVSYKNEIDKSFNDFVGSLGTKFRAAAPGNLLTTSGTWCSCGRSIWCTEYTFQSERSCWCA
jgi:hypothetical protein